MSAVGIVSLVLFAALGVLAPAEFRGSILYSLLSWSLLITGVMNLMLPWLATRQQRAQREVEFQEILAELEARDADRSEP